jgi:hypothetical protein
MTCCVCGQTAVVFHRHEDFCQFHWDCLRHELKIILDAIRDYGQYVKETGPQFGVTYYGYIPGDPENRPKYAKAGVTTLGYGLYVSKYPKEAMEEAMRIAARNNWKLLRLDVQGGASNRLGLQTCTNIFVSPDFQKYMEYSDLGAMCYDERKWGRIVL